MEKYYLGSLGAGATTRVKLVHLEQEPIHDSQVGASARRSCPAFVYLEPRSRPPALSLVEFGGAQAEARLKPVKRLELGHIKQAPVDFDLSEQIALAPSHHIWPQCILLTADGLLSAISLIDGALDWQIAPTRESRAQPLACRLQQVRAIKLDDPDKTTSVSDHATSAEDGHFIHLLTDRHYSLYRLERAVGGEQQGSLPLDLALQHSHPLGSSVRRFVSLLPMATNASLVLLELDDGTLRIIERGVCRASLEPGARSIGCRQQMLLLTGGSSEEALLVRLDAECKLQAHRIQVQAEESSDTRNSDPDKLLMREPSLELEHCWSMDLHDIDSVRAMQETLLARPGASLQDQIGLMWPVWHNKQVSPNEAWPKFLALALGHHLLVYSFDCHRTSAPFVLTYDSAFMELAPANASDSEDNRALEDLVDVFVRPKLLHNFKLTGAQPADGLFNTLLMTSAETLHGARHYHEANLELVLTKSNHVLAFKFTSSKLVGMQQDSVYQQNLIDSLRSGSSLQEQIDRLDGSNASYRGDLMRLEKRLNSNQMTNDTRGAIGDLLKSSLVQRTDIGTLYDLILSISGLVPVARIIVLTNVRSHILKPTCSRVRLIEATRIDNQTSSRSPVIAHLMLYQEMGDDPADNLDAMLHEISDNISTARDDVGVQAWASIELDIAMMRQHMSTEEVIITLPMFIMDGQHGFVQAVFVVEESDSVHELGECSTLFKHLDLGDTNMNYEQILKQSFCHSHSVKPLMSYKQLSRDKLVAQNDLEGRGLIINGPFSMDQMQSWLCECIDLRIQQTTNCQFESNFTHCRLSLECSEGRLLLKSDDPLAMDLVKRHVMKRATDGSIKLDIDQQGMALHRDLRHLIGLQYVNIKVLQDKRNSRASGVAGRNKNHMNINDGKEMLSETIVGSFTPDELPIELRSHSISMEKSIRQDIKQLIASGQLKGTLRADNEEGEAGEDDPNQSIEDDSPPNDDEISLMRDIICGYIIDALIDSEKFLGLKIQESAIETLTATIRTTVIEALEDRRLGRGMFVDKILNE